MSGELELIPVDFGQDTEYSPGWSHGTHNQISFTPLDNRESSVNIACNIFGKWEDARATEKEEHTNSNQEPSIFRTVSFKLLMSWMLVVLLFTFVRLSSSTANFSFYRPCLTTLDKTFFPVFNHPRGTIKVIS